jgi:hypothetical protein
MDGTLFNPRHPDCIIIGAMADTIRTYLRDASTPLLTDTLGLTMMPKHIDTLVGSALFFTFIHLVVAPKLSQAFFPEAYGKADKKFQNNW